MTEVNLYGNHVTSHSQPHAKLRVHSVDVLYGDNTTVFWTNTHDNTLVSMPISSTHEQAVGRDGRTRRDSPSSPFTVVVSYVVMKGMVLIDQIFVHIHSFIHFGRPHTWKHV